MLEEKDISYEGYVSVHFSQIHNVENMEKEYNNYYKFFMVNYFNELPKDRECSILDMGCGLGETLYSLKN